MDPTLVSLIVFAGLLLFVAAVAMVIRDARASSRATVAQRLGENGGAASLERLPDPETRAARGPVGRFDRWFERLVAETGLDMNALSAFLMIILGGVLVGGLVFVWRDRISAALFSGLAGMAVVFLFLLWRRGRRRRLILNQLPEVIEMLARSVRAGRTLDQSFELVGETVADPMGREMRRCARHLDMGLSMEAALSALSRRAPLSEMRILVATLIVQRRAGGQLPVTLERLARVIRDRVSYRRQFRAATAAARISAILIAAAGPLVVIYMMIWQPEYVQRFLDHPQGQMLLMVAIGLLIIGSVWVAAVLRNDY